ncbi:MAG: hypothetical protein HC882_01165 [Acidobacteria bacterium]|nr:hypothetical protein [Acidobacteriota bacterium]
MFGIEPDAQGHFTLAETHFADGETSFVRIRGEGDALSAYSLAVSVSRDESVTETSDNTIRALSLGRSGTDIALCQRPRHNRS